MSVYSTDGHIVLSVEVIKQCLQFLHCLATRRMKPYLPKYLSNQHDFSYITHLTLKFCSVFIYDVKIITLFALSLRLRSPLWISCTAHLQFYYLCTHTDVKVDEHHTLAGQRLCKDERSTPLPQVNPSRYLCWIGISHLKQNPLAFYINSLNIAIYRTILISAAGPVIS